MTADQKRWRMLLIGMTLIIGFSGVMHVFLVKRKAIRTHRYEPQYGGAPRAPSVNLQEGEGEVEGEVLAASYDKFFLRVGGLVQPIAIGDQRMPEVGDLVTISYRGGTPPTALAITSRRNSPAQSPPTPSK